MPYKAKSIVSIFKLSGLNHPELTFHTVLVEKLKVQAAQTTLWSHWQGVASSHPEQTQVGLMDQNMFEEKPQLQRKPQLCFNTPTALVVQNHVDEAYSAFLVACRPSESAKNLIKCMNGS